MKSLYVVFLLALILRFFVIFWAHHGDLNNNISWGTLAVERGLNNFYEGEDWPYSAPNQPPLTILLFWVSRLIWQFIENTSWWLNNNLPAFPSSFIWFWESKGMDFLVKFPSIIADLGIAILIYNFFERTKKALFVSSVWLFNPLVWYNSSVWGQTDSVVNFLGLAGVLYLLKKDLARFAGFFTLSLLFKGSLAVFAPLLFAVVIWQKYTIKRWAHSVIVAVLTAVIVSIWFHPKLDLFLWLLTLYNERILPGEIGYLTANAFNFWWLIDSGKTLDSTVYFGLPARIWGFVITTGGVAGMIFWLKRNLSDKNLLFSLAAISLIAFLFMTRIHERYLYPFFPYATILLGYSANLIGVYAIISLGHLFNLYHLFWIPPIPFLENLFGHGTFPKAIASLNLVSFLWFLKRGSKV